MFRTIWDFKTRELMMNNCFAIQRYRALNIIILLFLILIQVNIFAFSILSLLSRRKLVGYFNSSLIFLLKKMYTFTKNTFSYVSICVCNAQCTLEIPLVLHETWSVGTSAPDLIHWIKNITRSINGILMKLTLIVVR